ncbi:MAG TPA: hypothetical protein VFC19_54015 [Candidatus Limnocylindrales bacterium]|nr:hypothetical protein [Candidatus Limnocylindrales bacterium]
MAEYSGTPLARKLGLKPEHRLVLRHAPRGWSIPDPPPGVETVGEVESADVVVAFYRTHADLAAEAPSFADRLRQGSMLWIAWPRKAGGHTSDIAENDLRELLLPTGLVDVKVAALDDDWSGLKFVWRKR